MIKKVLFALLAAVAVIALPACENGGDNGGNGGNDDKNAIIMDRQGSAYYLGKVWDFQGEEHANYYVTLANCEIGQSVQTGFEVPMEVGGWILFLDLWAEASEDTANAVLPEGEYTFSNQREMYVVYDQFTISTANTEKVGNQYRIIDRPFKGGTVNVEHTSKGYAIKAELTTTIDGEDVELTFKYNGPIVFDDKSDDEPWEPGMNDDININPVKATVDAYPGAAEGVDSFVIRLFDTEISADGTHPAAPGHMIMLDLYTEAGADFAGDYRPGTMNGSTMVKEPGVFYPGKFWGGIALGSYVERVYPDMTTESDILTGGTIEIRNAVGGKYGIRVNMTTGNGHKVSCEYTGAVESFGATTSSLLLKRPTEIKNANLVEVR